MILKLATANRATLDAEIELYREGGVEVEVPEKATNDVLKALIEKLIETEGTPVKIDEAFLEANKELVAVVEAQGETMGVDEILFFSKADFDAAEAQKVENAKELPPPPLEDEKEKPKAGEGIHAAKENASANRPVASLAGSEDLVYIESRDGKEGRPKTVVSVSNVIVAGHSYKDVTVTSGETFRISAEEFNRDVKYRS